MDKQFLKHFCEWLEQSSTDELLRKQQEVLAARKMITEDEAQATAKVLLRLIDEELVVRSNLLQLKVL